VEALLFFFLLFMLNRARRSNSRRDLLLKYRIWKTGQTKQLILSVYADTLKLAGQATAFIPGRIPKSGAWFLIFWRANFPESHFKREFRMIRPNFIQLQQLVFGGVPGDEEWMLHRLKLGITIYRLAHHLPVLHIGHSFAVSSGTVFNYFRETVGLINALQGQFIASKWPQSNEAYQVLVASQLNRYGGNRSFPGAFASIDGTHIPIQQPVGDDFPVHYINRKGFHSIQLQAVANHTLQFLHITVGHAGSSNDSRVLRDSEIWQLGDVDRAIPVKFHILADAGYPLRIWLITPYSYRNVDHLEPADRRFNARLSGVRAEVERAFGRLKGRWKRLRFLDVALDFAPQVILCCCVLHNIVESFGEHFDRDEEQQEILRERRLRNRMGWLPMRLPVGADANVKRDGIRDNL